MTTEQIDFDTQAIQALNANIIKCLDGKKVADMLSKALSPEERRLLARATGDYKNGHYNAAVTRYKAYVTSKSKHPATNSEQCRLDVIVQYLVSKCLLHSNQFQELIEVKTTLTDLEASVGNTYPMIYYGLAQFYIAVFCFEEADRMSTKGLSVANTGDFPVCYLPESKDLIKESTKEELTMLLLSLKEQCSGWHPPDARCFMTICRMTSQNHICGRDIFLKSPAYNGMVTITCSNTTNPCEIHFHCACWKVKKDEASSIAKISDKEVLLNWECFTPNCGTENEPSVIKKITIHKEDGSVKDIEPPLDKSNWHIQHPSSASKGAIRKQKHVSKISSAKVLKSKQTIEKNNETTENNNHAAFANINPEGSGAPQDIVDGHVPSESQMICDPFTLKAMKMISLRELNFNINPDNDWKPNEAYYGNEHMRSTIDTSYEPDFSEDTETVARIKAFLFSHFLSFIENRGPVKNDDLMEEWSSLTECSDFDPIAKNLNGIIEVRKFLLQSLKFVAAGNYICIPELLPGAYALIEEESELKAMDMMRTVNLGGMHLRRKKKSEAASDMHSGKVKPTAVPDKRAKSEPVDPFMLTPEDLLDEVEGESDDDEYNTTMESSESSKSNQIFETPVKRMKVQETNDVGDVKKNLEEGFIEEEGEEGSVEKESEDDEVDSDRVCEKNEEDKLGKCVETCEREQEIIEVNGELQEVNKKSQNITKTSPIQPDEHSERYIIENESEGTLDDQDDLPWDVKIHLPTEEQACKKCEACKCDKLSDLEATIASLQEELQSSRDELQRSSERLKMSEDECQKNQDELQKTRDELQKSRYELQNTRETLKNSKTKLEKTRDELTTEKCKFKEMKRKLSIEILDSKFNHNHAVITSKRDLTQAQYAIVAKLQNLVHQTTKNYLSVDWTEWAVPLEKLETMLSSLQEEHRRHLKLINSDETPEENSLATNINMLNVLSLPQRNIPDLIEIAFNMLKNHFQSVVSYRRAMLPPGLTQVPPIIPLWYQQQPRYATPSIPPTPFHHQLLNSMMASSNPQFPSGYSRPAYMRPGLQREAYPTYLGTPITITDVSPMPGSTPPEHPMPTIQEKVPKTPERTSESESLGSDKSEKFSGSSDKAQQTSNNWRESADEEGSVGLHEEVQASLQVSLDGQEPVPAVPVVPEIVKTAKETVAPSPMSVGQAVAIVKDSQIAVEPPAQAHVSTRKHPTSSDVTDVPKPVLRLPKMWKNQLDGSNSGAKTSIGRVPNPVPASIVKIAPVVSLSTSPVSTTVDPKRTTEAPKVTPHVKPPTVASAFAASVALAASSPHPVAEERSKLPENIPPSDLQVPPPPIPQAVMTNATATPPSTKFLKAIDPKTNQATNEPVQPVKNIVHHGLVKAKLSEQSAPPHQPQNPQAPGRSNEMLENGAEVKRRKAQSMDKLMARLRDKYPEVLEYDLIWSIRIVRKNHNDSLNGILLNDIVAEAEKFISLRQKLQLIPYSSSNKTSTVKSQGVSANTCPGRSDNDPNCSTASTSSLHRDHPTKMNPWGKPQDVSWVKESPEADCVICWEALITESKPPYTLKCQHTFHKQCLVNWFIQDRSCPTCRTHSTIDDDFPPLP